MATAKREITREEMKAALLRQRAAYEEMEIDRLCTPWREATLEEKLAFDELLRDVNLRRGPSRECGMVEWYRRLLRAKNSE